jgi:hypothetical protein
VKQKPHRRDKGASKAGHLSRQHLFAILFQSRERPVGDVHHSVLTARP